MTIKVIDFEISDIQGEIWGFGGDEGIYLFVRFKGAPLKWVYVDNTRRQESFRKTELVEYCLDYLHYDLGLSLLRENFSQYQALSEKVEPISVVVCTRDRIVQLKECLKALLSLDYPYYEIIVVDNAPINADTARLVNSLSVRYVREDRAGLDYSRNRGIIEAKYNIIAFTDDDVCVDRNWLWGIRKGFLEPGIMAVTGLVAPLELEAPAQQIFEFQYSGMGKGFEPKVFRGSQLSEIELLSPHAIGVGANMAFRKKLFYDVGPFNIALDVGTPTAGAGDLEMFHRILAKQYTIRYEPTALVWHRHRRCMQALAEQIYNNGRGFGSFLAACAENRTVSYFSVCDFAFRHWLRWLIHRAMFPVALPRYLALWEIIGAIGSPFYYINSRRKNKSISEYREDFIRCLIDSVT